MFYYTTPFSLLSLPSPSPSFDHDFVCSLKCILYRFSNHLCKSPSSPPPHLTAQSNAKARTADVVGRLLGLAPKTATLLRVDPGSGRTVAEREIPVELVQVGCNYGWESNTGCT